MTKLSKQIMSVALVVAVSASSAFSGPLTTKAKTTQQTNQKSSQTAVKVLAGNDLIASSADTATNPAITATPTAVATTTPTAVVTNSPSVAPTAIPTQVPTAAEILATAKPVNGPHVETNYGEKARFADSSKNDYIYVELNLAGGATSATYTLDGGVPKTITEDTVIKVGQGKIANSDITLQVTSTNGTTTNTQTFTYVKTPNYQDTVKQVLSQTMANLFATLSNAAQTTSDKKETYKVTFTAPSDWKGPVYAYAYYKDANDKTQKPLGIWPGSKTTDNKNGTYSINVDTTVGFVNVVFADVTKPLPTAITTADPTNSKSEDRYDVGTVKQLPETGGLKVTGDCTISKDGTITNLSTATATPTITPTATPVAEPTLQAYFGAEKSAPQLTTTKQTISTVASNAKGILTYRFFVDDTLLYKGTNNSVIWDPSALKIGYHRLTVYVTDTTDDGKQKSIMLTKNYILTDIYGTTPEPTEVPTEEPVVPTTPGAVTTIPGTSQNPGDTTNAPENSQNPGDTTNAPENSQNPGDTTNAPENSQNPGDTTNAPENSQNPGNATNAPESTQTPVATIVPTATPNTTTNGAIVTDNTIASGNVSGSAVTGSVIFAKKGKTVGEDVTIKVITANKKKGAKYTYSYYVGSKAIAKNSKKTSATWTTSKKGTFTVKVNIYENGKKVATASAKYAVKARVITIKSLKTNKKSGQKKNTPITITAKATTKKGKVSYKFAVQKGNGSIVLIKDYAKKGTVTWTPTKKGTYKLYVYVKNGKGVIVKKTKTFKVK